jgi:hypothetical protein
VASFYREQIIMIEINTLKPSAEWIAEYRAKTVPPPGRMSIAPTPEMAWACEIVLGDYTPATVLTAIQEDPEAWAQVRWLHARIMHDD